MDVRAEDGIIWSDGFEWYGRSDGCGGEDIGQEGWRAGGNLSLICCEIARAMSLLLMIFDLRHGSCSRDLQRSWYYFQMSNDV